MNVIFATLATPVGLVRLVFCRPDRIVEPLVKVAELAVGGLENSGVVPAATDAIVSIVGS